MNSALESRLNRLQQRLLVVGALALALSAGWAVANPTQFFRSYLLAYVFWVGFPLGCLALLMLHHLADGRPLYSHPRRHEAAVCLDPSGGALGSLVAAETFLPEHAVLHRTRHRLLPLLDRRRLLPEQVVVRAGQTDGRAGAARPVPGVERRWTRDLRADHHLRQRRLGDVAREGVLLDHLRDDLHGGARARRARLRSAGGAPARRVQAALRRRRGFAFPGPRQPAAHLRHDLGVSRVLAIPHHLGRQPSGRDSLVHEPRTRSVGRGGAAPDPVLLGNTVCPAAQPADKAAHARTGRGGNRTDGDEPGRHLLDGGAGLPAGVHSRPPYGSSDSGGHRRVVGFPLRRRTQEAAAPPAA